jgi:hypothetical protein
MARNNTAETPRRLGLGWRNTKRYCVLLLAIIGIAIVTISIQSCARGGGLNSDAGPATTEAGPDVQAKPICGNSLIETGEECDRLSLNNETCMRLRGEEGELTCGSNCRYDESRCYPTTGRRDEAGVAGGSGSYGGT